MAKKADIEKLLAEFYAGDDTDEYVIGQAAGMLSPESKVDMIAAGAVLMMARLADTHRVHLLDCMLAVPKWTALIVGSNIIKEHT